HAWSGEGLLRRADVALYAAKFAGKDRVQIFTGEPEEAPEPSDPPPLDTRGLRMLLVDDDPGLRILLRTTFEVVDIEVDEADSAGAAAEMIATRTPHVGLLDLERGQRALIQRAYRETVSALAGALESKDSLTGEHSQRVQRYAIELAQGLDPHLLADESVEYGFLLHDVGKIGIPDEVLQK